MNVPAQATANGVASSVIRAVPCSLEYCTVVNTSGAARFYHLADATSLPSLGAAATAPPTNGILSPRIAAGATWTVFPVDAGKGATFSRGCVLMSFGLKADGSADFTQLSAADANLVAWSAALQ